jgi:transcription initiation factor TFIIIB Brf1 subunit/transcription initiation factor TFIIB
VAQKCDRCGETVYRVKLLGNGQWVGEDCGCLRTKVVAETNNPFSELTLEHCHDEYGKPIRVTSLRQLQAAENRYGFASVVANMDDANVNTPPQQKRMEVADMYQWKFNRRMADEHHR